MSEFSNPSYDPPLQVHYKIPVLPSLAVGIVMLTLFACAGAPVQDMSNARQAIAAAQQAGAAHAAASEMAEAQRLMKLAQEELDQGDYSDARQNAVRARTAAEKALRMSQANPTPP